MKIGLDLSVIQTPHRMRGIGATAINFVNNLSEDIKKQHTFVIFLYEKNQEEALGLLNLENVDYKIQTLIEIKPINLGLPGQLNILSGIANNMRKLRNIFSGDPRIRDIKEIESFLQFDQMSPLPKTRHIKTALVLYDIIPYVMESDYLWTYKTARAHGDSRKSSLRKHILRGLYKFETRAITKRADILIAISQHTKNDFVRYIGIKPSSIQVVHLGITKLHAQPGKSPEFKHYIENSWGYFPKPIDLSDTPFLLFVGGADPRRRLNDLVAAFNNLRAEGTGLRLVLAGDTMKGPHAIPVIETQKYIVSSSYLNDIIFLGFIDEIQKNWLYQNTVAFVYPSVYEGFGLPILEAMQNGAPVITYKNTSISEISGEAVLYAEDYQGIKNNIELILNNPKLREQTIQSGIAHAKSFSWEATVKDIFSKI